MVTLINTIAWPGWVTAIDWTAIGTKTLTVSLQLISILIFFYIVRALGRKFIHTTFDKMQLKNNISSGRAKTLERLILNLLNYSLIFFLVTLIAGIFEYNITALVAGAGVVGLAIGFGAQGLVSDVVTGFFLLLEKQLEVDEYITVAGLDGIVEEIGIRTTQLRGFDGTLHYIPNREIIQLSNHSRGTMRALVDISIGYSENIDETIRLLQETCDRIAANEPLITEGPHVLGVHSLGDSDVVIRILAKTVNMEQWGVERTLRKEIKDVLDANNIEIPFPYQVNIEKKQ